MRPMTMETRYCKAFFPNCSKINRLKILSHRRCVESVFFNICFVHAAARGGTCAFTLKIVNTQIKDSSHDDRASISTSNQPTANPLRDGQGQ